MKPQATTVLICPDCGAANHIDDRKCWRCGRLDWMADTRSRSAVGVVKSKPTDWAGEKSSGPTNGGGWSVVWALLLLLWLPISFGLALAIGEVWAWFVDKPGIQPHQSIKVLVIPFILMPAIAALYLIGLAIFFVCRVFLGKG